MPSPLRVLRVDDNLADLALVQAAFEAVSTQADITTYTGGPDALSALLESQRAVPDVVVLDINMPGMSGSASPTIRPPRR